MALCRFGAALVVGVVICVGLSQRRCALVVSWLHFRMCPVIFPAEALRKQRGAELLLLVCECATNLVLIRAKAFTDTLVGGSSDDAFGVSFSPLGAPLRGILS
jgi:hypothetical protein